MITIEIKIADSNEIKTLDLHDNAIEGWLAESNDYTFVEDDDFEGRQMTTDAFAWWEEFAAEYEKSQYMVDDMIEEYGNDAVSAVLADCYSGEISNVPAETIAALTEAFGEQ
jgi:hypothetical protein